MIAVLQNGRQALICPNYSDLSGSNAPKGWYFFSSNLLFLALVLGNGPDVMARKNTQQPIFLSGAHDGRVRRRGEIGSFMSFFTEP